MGRRLAQFLIWIASAGLSAAGPLEDARTTYEERRAEIDAAVEKNHEALLALYAQGLEKLEARFKARTDLEGLIALRQEINRLQSARELSTLHIRAEVEDLAALQKAVLERIEQLESLELDRLGKVMSAYLADLEAAKDALTRADKLDQALSVKEEIELVKAGPEYDRIRRQREAEEEERRRRLAALKEKRDNRPGPFRPPKLTRKTSFAAGIAAYRKGEEPLGNMKRLAIDFTSRESRAAAIKMTGRAGLISIQDSGNSYYPNRFIPRLILSTSNQEGYKNCTVLFEYFTKDRGSSRSRAFSEWIKLDEMKAGQPMVIDGRGYRSKHYTGSSYSYLYFGYVSSDERSPNTGYHTGSYSSYDDFGGIIFSVYDANKKLLFQKASQRAIAELARPTFVRPN